MVDEQQAPPTQPQEPTTPEAPERTPKVIKRYTNRKLYDTVESRYVTLDEIAAMIKSGADVQIVDNRTKEDLTSVTLAQIIFEEEKKTSKMSLKTLLALIRSGGEKAAQLVEGTQAEFRERVEAVRQAAEQRVQTLIHRSQQTSDRAKELVATSQEAVQQFQRRIDERVKAAIDGMSAVTDQQRELAELSRKLDELERRLAEMEKK
jgi:polyhydroxyalkanoate synthesis repressor PhaR